MHVLIGRLGGCERFWTKRRSQEGHWRRAGGLSDGGVRGDELLVPNLHFVRAGFVRGAMDNLPRFYRCLQQEQKFALSLLRVYALAQVSDVSAQADRESFNVQQCHLGIDVDSHGVPCLLHQG